MEIKGFHTSRRTIGDQLADDLSKGLVGSTATLLPDSVDVSEKVSKVLLHWITDPYVKMELGRSVLLEIQRSIELDIDVGFNNQLVAVEHGILCLVVLISCRSNIVCVLLLFSA